MKFELTLAIKSGDKIDRFEKIGADDLVHLLSLFNLIIVQVQRDIFDEALADARRHSDDDIPF